MVNPDIPVSIKVLIRSIFGLLFFAPLLIKHGFNLLTSNNISLHLKRIAFMSVAMGGTYYAYTHLSFAIATSVGFTGPIFTAVLAYFILKDRLNFQQWMAIVAGYVGVVIMTNPQGDISSAIIVAIFANIFTGLSLIYARKLTATDDRNTIVILGNMGVIVTSALWTVLYWISTVYQSPAETAVWVLPQPNDFILLMLMGFLGALSQSAYVNALRYASPSFLAPFEYSRLVIAVPIGLTLGEALPNQHELIGIGVIILSTLYMTWQGRKNA